ncbi:unnamed protein product [Effrenium voratum]|nr:unnamed protein product [Effrenium voratum]
MPPKPFGHKAGKGWCRACWADLASDAKYATGYCSHCWRDWNQAKGERDDDWVLIPDDTKRFQNTHLPLGQILFSQSTIADNFRNGTKLSETIEKLQNCRKFMYDLPRISVVKHDGRNVSMDNRRLYCLQMAFADNTLVPVKLFEDVDAYGAEDFSKKATSICGGQMVEVRSSWFESSVDLEIPRHGKVFLAQSQVNSVLKATGASYRIGKESISFWGSHRQVEEAVRQYQRVLGTYAFEEVELLDAHLKDYLWEQDFKNRYPSVDLSIRNEVLAQLGGEKEQVIAMKSCILELVKEHARIWESVSLPAHSGPYFRQVLTERQVKCSVDERSDLVHFWGNASSRDAMKNVVAELQEHVRTKQLQEEDAWLRKLIIGRQGVNVKQLCCDTKVHIKVGPDMDPFVRITGPKEEVDLVAQRLKAFLRENRWIDRELASVPGARRYLLKRLKAIQLESEARVTLSREEEKMRIRGNQRQVDYAEEMVERALAEFGSVALRVNRHLVSQLLGQQGQHIQELKADLEAEVWVPKDTDASQSHATCQVTGRREDCQVLVGKIWHYLRQYDVVIVPMEPKMAGLVIGRGGCNIKDLKAGLQIHEDTRKNPWVITGPTGDVNRFVQRLQLRFSVGSLGGLQPVSLCCPGCDADFPTEGLLVQHVEDGRCAARMCAGACGGYFPDQSSCEKHEKFCSSVKRCPGCQRGFASDKAVKVHVLATGCQACCCEGCSTIFHDSSALQEHQTTCELHQEWLRDQEVRREIQDFKRSLCDPCRMGEQKGSDCSKCKASLRKAQLRWHPDKNPENPIVSTIIFRSVQAVWNGEPGLKADESNRKEDSEERSENPARGYPRQQQKANREENFWEFRERAEKCTVQ